MKEILVCFFRTRIELLVPKVRGSGFRKVPLGHHDCAISRLAYDIGYDIFGLDGALEIDTGHVDNREQLIEKAVKPIATLLGMSWRIVNASEYWANHPIKTEPTK